MHKTPFAGLTAPDPNDPPLQVDGGSFATRNPDITDHFLRIGCLDHVHDAHPALPNPVVGPSATVDTTVGSIPSGRDLYVGFTLLDNYGGETLLSPPVNISTPDPLEAPSTPLTVEFEPDVGNTVVGTFAYAITLVDDGGGETLLGPVTQVNRPAGTEFGQFNISGLAAELGPDFGASWRLWRADNGGDFHIIAAGATDTFTDDGINPTDLAASPPTTAIATRSTNSLVITLPDATAEPGMAIGSATSGIAVYISNGGAFVNPSFYSIIPIASAGGATITVPDLELQTGAPPDVSTSIPGARKITGSEIEGGGVGGGLFSYPQDFETTFAGDWATTELGGDLDYIARAGADPVVLISDREFAGTPYGTMVVDPTGSGSVSPDMSPYPVGEQRAGRVYLPNAPGIREGTVTVEFSLNDLDADLNAVIHALMGAPGRPHAYVSVNPYVGGIGIDVGIGERSLSDFYIAVASNSVATTLANATSYWLRLTRDGTAVTGELFDEDPALNPAAVALVSVTGDLADYSQSMALDWATRENSMPGFGWDLTDNMQRSDAVRFLSIAAHATAGGDGYSTVRPTRVTVFDHESELRPRRAINFSGELVVQEEMPPGYSGDFVTVRVGKDIVTGDGFDYAPGSAWYDPQQNVAPFDGLGEIHPVSAGDDARLISPEAFEGDPWRSELEISNIEPGDVVGLILKAIDIDNFLVAQVDNTTASTRLQIGSMDANVFTELAGVDIQDLSAGTLFWLRFEWYADDLGVALYTVNPYLSVAAADAQVGHRLVDPAKTTYGGAVPNRVGLRMVSAAGGANGLRVSDWRGAR